MMMQGQTTSPNSTKSILKQKSEDEDFFWNQNKHSFEFRNTILLKQQKVNKFCSLPKK